MTGTWGQWPLQKRTGGSGRAAFSPLSIPTLYSWWRADTYTDEAGKVGALPDLVPAGRGIKLIDATHRWSRTGIPARQCALPVPDAAMNNQLCLTFTGGQDYDSTAPAIAWALLHDGSGSEWFAVYKNPALGNLLLLHSTATPAGSTTTQVGTCCDVYNAGGAQTQEFRIGNGTGAIVNSSVGNAAVAGAPGMVNMRYQESASPEWSQYYKTTLRTSGASAAAPSLAAPFATCRFGKDVALGNASIGVEAERLYFYSVLTATERANVVAYISARYAMVIP